MDRMELARAGLAQGAGASAGTANTLRDFGAELFTPPAAFLESHGAMDDDEFAGNADFASLREMGADADVALAANKAYQAELMKAMDRVDAARKRISELEASFRASDEAAGLPVFALANSSYLDRPSSPLSPKRWPPPSQPTRRLRQQPPQKRRSRSWSPRQGLSGRQLSRSARLGRATQVCRSSSIITARCACHPSLLKQERI